MYAALLAHGTELDAAGVALMMPALLEAAIAEAMPRLEDEAVWRQANALVLEFLHRHAVVKVWGEWTFASADAMSLEASRHLWNARVDPRRRTDAMGIYSHVLDQWGIIYDQPLVFHQRQAGAAIEGIARVTFHIQWRCFLHGMWRTSVCRGVPITGLYCAAPPPDPSPGDALSLGVRPPR